MSEKIKLLLIEIVELFIIEWNLDIEIEKMFVELISNEKLIVFFHL